MRVSETISKIRLEYKILMILALSLTLGLGTYVIYSIQAESKALLDQSRQKSELFAESLKSGIRNVMLAGRPTYVRSFVDETRQEFKSMGRLRLFNNEALEIYSETEAFISKASQDTTASNFLMGLNDVAALGENYRVLRNEETCQDCHGSDTEYRGLVRLNIDVGPETFGHSMGVVAKEVFNSIMLSGKGEHVDELLVEVEKLEQISLAQVYDQDGYYVAFGNDDEELPETFLESAAGTFRDQDADSHLRYTEQGRETFIFPLRNKEACQVCHGSDHSLRGMLSLSIDTSVKPDKQAVEKLAIQGFKSMMLLDRGLYAGNYVDQVRSLPFVKEFAFLDNGRRKADGVHELYLPNPLFTEAVYSDSVNKIILAVNKPGEVDTKKLEYEEMLAGEGKHLTQVIPLSNDEKCQACHEPPKPDDPLYQKYGDRWKVRSVLEVSTSMAAVEQAIQRNIYASISVGLFTIILVGVILRIFIKLVVLNPLNVIGTTVGAVGDGNLAVSAQISSRDEIGELAGRINMMIQGLRERLHLTKFVSFETVEAVKSCDLSGVRLGGERREATVLFSDIRGFTSFSETVDPEHVVSMLNTILNEQAQIVRRHGGDIDKYVGDELMAVFQNEDAVDRSLACAIELQHRMAELNAESEDSIHIGIGINTGPMVMGAIGSVDRMDFTVIGDSVNLGARLCGAAGPDQILISEYSKGKLSETHSFNLEQVEAIYVKGKTNPVQVFSANLER
jgi:adenylate cyclase